MTIQIDAAPIGTLEDADHILASRDADGRLERLAASAFATGAEGDLATTALQDLLDDTAPALGGDLDVNGSALTDGAGLELLSFTEVGSAINELDVRNAAIGNGPRLAAVGDDTDIDIEIAAKGTGDVVLTGPVLPSSTVDGRDLAVDGAALDLIEASATADQTDAEIRTAVDAATDSNVLTDTLKSKLDAIESLATADQSAAEILTALLTVDGSGSLLDADFLDGISSAGFATAAQGSTADTALQDLLEDTSPQLGANLNVNGFVLDDINSNTILGFTPVASAVNFVQIRNHATGSDPMVRAAGADTDITLRLASKGTGTILVEDILQCLADITTTGLVDGRDIDADGTTLDLIEASATADQTDAEIRTAVDAATDSNVLTDTLKTKLDGIAAAATIDQTATEIGVAVHLIGTAGARPAAGAANDGVYYTETDTDGGTTFRSNASTWVKIGGGVTSSGMANLVEDVSPELGADLSLNGFEIDDTNGNTILGFSPFASAVNYVQIRNNATGGDPYVRVQGDDANITLRLASKGTGNIIVEDTLQCLSSISVVSTVDGRDVGTDGTKLDTIADNATANPNAIDNVLEDTAPALGGDLNVNGFGLDDANGNEVLVFVPNALAVNHFQMVTNATGGDPIFQAVGDDTNISLRLASSGTGSIVVEDTLQALAAIVCSGNISVSGTVDGRDIDTDGTKLDGVASGATNNAGALADLNTVGTTEIDNNAVSYAKMLDIPTDTFIGRDTAGSGDPETITLAAARTMLNVEAGSTADQSDAEIKTAYENNADTNEFSDAEQTKLAGIATGATVNSTDAVLLARANHTGTQLLSTISDSGALAALATVGETEISNAAVTLAKMANMATASLLGRNTGGSGVPEVLSATTARTLLNVENNADVTDEANVTDALDGATITAVTGTTGDRVLVLDDSDADNLKIVLWENLPGSGGGISNVVEDATPELGGNLEMQGFLLADTNGLELLDFTETASAINHFLMANAAVGNSPVLAAVGDDTNVDLTLTPKGTGAVVITAASIEMADGRGFVDANGNLTYAVGSVGSAVNYLKTVNSATGNNVKFETQGSDTDITLNIVAKGTGSVYLPSNNLVVQNDIEVFGNYELVSGNGITDRSGNEILTFIDVASAVNELTITNAIAAADPSITATGGDTDIDLTLDGKGTGTVKTLSSDLDITGDIVVSGLVDGRDVDTDGTKLDTIADNATANDTDANLLARANHTGTQTLATISDSAALAALATVGTPEIDDDAVTYAKMQNVVADERLLGNVSGAGAIVAELTQAQVITFLGIETAATADQTNAEIATAVEAATNSNTFNDADHTKLNAIEALADVTDAANVNTAGATMNTDSTLVGNSYFLDEDTMSSDDATKVPSQQSVKAYADKQPEVLMFALGDETTAITTGTAKLSIRMPFAMTLYAGNLGVKASLVTQSSSGIPTIDINEAGATILTTKLTIDASETTSLDAATAVVIGGAGPDLAADAVITFDIDVAGTGATGLKVTLMGTRT